MTVVGQCETSPFLRDGVLARRWPDVPTFSDLRLLSAERIRERCGDVDLLCGGFPCQDISTANTAAPRAGLGGKRSGLWSGIRSLIAECLPAWIILENSSRWRAWMPQVRAELARDGYASLPLVVSAGQVGAHHARPRGFVVAHADGDSEPLRTVDAEVARLCAVASQVPWPDPPASVGVAHGVPRRMDRLRALGNAVVPQVAEVIGRAILAADQ